MKYYILVKKKGQSSWQRAYPSKKNVSLSKLKSVVNRSIRSGFTYKIVSQMQLKSMVKRKKRWKYG